MSLSGYRKLSDSVRFVRGSVNASCRERLLSSTPWSGQHAVIQSTSPAPLGAGNTQLLGLPRLPLGAGNTKLLGLPLAAQADDKEAEGGGLSRGRPLADAKEVVRRWANLKP